MSAGREGSRARASNKTEALAHLDHVASILLLAVDPGERTEEDERRVGLEDLPEEDSAEADLDKQKKATRQ